MRQWQPRARIPTEGWLPPIAPYRLCWRSSRSSVPKRLAPGSLQHRSAETPLKTSRPGGGYAPGACGLKSREERLGRRGAEGCHQRRMIGFSDRKRPAVGGPLGDGGGRNERFCQRKIFLQIGVRVAGRWRRLEIEHDRRRWRCMGRPIALHQLSIEPEYDRIDITAA